MATKRKKKKASKRTVSKKKSAKRAPRPAKRRHPSGARLLHVIRYIEQEETRDQANRRLTALHREPVALPRG